TAGVAVFSGSGTWSGSSGTLWSANSNWTDANSIHAAPGTFAGFGSTDLASFTGSGATTISLLGANPSLRSLGLSGSNYALTGGTLTLNGSSGTATVSVSGSSSQSIASAVTLATAAYVTPQGGSTLTISGPIGGSGGLTMSGAGSLLLTGSDIYSGSTT